MRVTLAMTVWIVSVVPSHAYTASSLPGIENEDFIKDCVRIHNKFRSEVNPTASAMLYMTWDPALARIAKAWAKNCQFAHNGQLQSNKLHPNFTFVGENIWTGSVSIFSVSSAITNWHSEIQDYDFETQKCTHVCGHYTQDKKRRANISDPRKLISLHSGIRAQAE
ncbi:glioma pathogenesis-related protein 1 [Phoca vitulina]|uniref:glioma pathogenesis-related protein 1 n=1 Tax=Phoca vitulina TaxID=9720 RepID=UPI00139640C2|nr:glioma pathogenesis-related protein 1 [Phoca vitulina]